MIDMVESFYEEKSFDKSVYSLSITKFDGEKVFHLPLEMTKRFSRGHWAFDMNNIIFAMEVYS